MKYVGNPTSKVLQWIDLEAGNEDINPWKGRQGNIVYWHESWPHRLKKLFSTGHEDQGPLLLTWYNLNPTMDMWSHLH